MGNSKTKVVKSIRRVEYQDRCRCVKCEGNAAAAKQKQLEQQTEESGPLGAGPDVSEIGAGSEEMQWASRPLPPSLEAPLLHTSSSLAEFMRADARGVPSFWSDS